MPSLVDVPLRVDWVVVDGRVLRGIPVEHELAVVHLAHTALALARTEVPAVTNRNVKVVTGSWSQIYIQTVTCTVAL